MVGEGVDDHVLKGANSVLACVTAVRPLEEFHGQGRREWLQLQPANAKGLHRVELFAPRRLGRGKQHGVVGGH